MPQAQITKGRVVNEIYKENEKGIQNLYLIAATENSFNEIIVGAATGAELPALDRTAITIPNGGVLVVKVEEGVTENGSSYTTSNEDYVYLYKSGIEQQIVTAKEKLDSISGSIVEGTVKGTVGSDTNVTVNVGTTSIANDDSQTAAVQIANIPTGSISSSDLDKADIEVETKATIEEVAEGTSLFMGGAGTKQSPYLIYTEQDFCNIYTSEYAKRTAYGTKYYKVLADLDFQKNDGNYTVGNYGKDSLSEYSVLILIEEADIDLNGHNIVMHDSKGLFGWGNYLKLHDGNIYFQDEINRMIMEYYADEAIFENINTYSLNGKSNCNTRSLFVYENLNEDSGNGCNFSYINCNNYANITFTGEGTCFGLFLRTANANSAIKFNGCKNYGNITGKRVSMFVGDFNTSINLTVTDCENNASIVSTTATITKNSTTYPNNPYFATANTTSWSNVKVNKMAISNTMTLPGTGSCIWRAADETLALTANGSTITLTKATDSTITKYVVKCYTKVNYMDKNTINPNYSDRYYDQYGWDTYTITETISASDISGVSKVINLKNYKFYGLNSYITSNSNNNWEKYNNATKQLVTIDGNTYTVIKIDGTDYYMIPNNYEIMNNQAIYSAADLYSGTSSTGGVMTSTIILEAYAGDNLMYSVTLK